MMGHANKIPWGYQVANAVGRILTAVRSPLLSLNESTVCNKAIQLSGLTDFGNPYFREGLTTLLESGRNDARFHPLGQFMFHRMVVQYLSQRLKLVENIKRSPELFSKKIIPPIIITGLARSGTTFLHNILALNPLHRAIPYWELTSPFPEPAQQNNEPDHRMSDTQKSIKFREPLLQGLDSIHFIRADSPEECINLMGITFNSLLFPTVFPVSSYMEWYLENACAPEKYKEYHRVLQYYQHHKPELRLTMKAPAHTSCLGTLLKEIPEAMVIQTHRDPVTCINSACNLISTFHGAVTNHVNITMITKLMINLYEVWTARTLAFRKSNPGKIYDLDYERFVADPLNSVKEIYRNFNLEWTTDNETRLQKYISENPKNKYGKHRYSLDSFQLNREEISSKLKPYIDYFDL
jgi:hypothetical protein